MYVAMKLVEIESLASCATCLKIFWFTFKKRYDPLQIVMKSFCSIWYVSCASMSRSITISIKNSRIATTKRSYGATTWELLVSI